MAATEGDEKVTAPWDLASFETEYVPTQTPALRWSVEKYKAAQLLALSGKNKKQTARELKIPVSIIDAWLQNPEFDAYMQSLVEDYGKTMKNNNIMLLNKILQARIEQAEIDGYADLSRKDTLDIITEIRKETGEDKAAESNYVGLLEKLVNHSLKQQQQIINVGGEGSK